MDWHLQLTPDLRNHLVYKFMLSIFPPYPPMSMHVSMQYVDYARQVEGDIYNMASSRADYYRLWAEKIYEVQLGQALQQM